MNNLASKYTSIKARIQAAELQYGKKPGSVALLAVSKGQSPAAIQTLHELGQVDFGENYLQEALPKIQALNEIPLIWHFIGAIQSNKCEDIAHHFHWVHTLSKPHHALLLSQKRASVAQPLNVCIQIKLDNTPNRAGISLEEAPSLIQKVAKLPHLQLRGLMTLLPVEKEFAKQRQYYNLVKTFYHSLQKQGFPLDTLSMGMTDDLEAAISEDANCVRIGRGLFGKR